MILHNASIKQKMQAIILVTAASVLLLSLLLFMMIEISSARDEAETRLNSLATVLGANSSAALVFRDKRAAAEILATLASQKDILWAGIYHRENELFAEYRSPGFKQTREDAERKSSMAFLLGRIVVDEPVVFDDKPIGSFHIIGNMSRAHTILLQQSFLGLGIFTVSMLFAMLLSSRLQRVVSVPVRRLLDTMNVVANKKDFGYRAKRLGNDELGTLVDGFNLMLEQLETYDHELNTYRQNLERLVDERTQDLESAKLQAESANKAKSLFLASISHEIRTPLNGVLGMVQVIHGTSLDAEQKHYLETLDCASKSLRLLIDDLLDLSKIESGKLTLDIEPFETFQWITDIQNLTEPLFDSKDTVFITETDIELPSYLEGDAARLLQIVVNLLSNAAKFTPHGEVRLTVGGDRISETEFNLRVSVKDSGIGIAEDELAQIFKAFHQLESVRNTNKGVGLGLAICKHLADAMQGNIQVTSEHGSGSCFTLDVSLPVPDAAAHAAEDQESTVMLRPLSILLADDDLINRMAARTLLQQRGHHIVEAGNGIGALEKLQQQSFDIILMDVHMPVMDGISATRVIRESSESWNQVLIIGVTASVMSDERNRYIQAGMDAVVEKPIIIEKLMKSIQQLLDRDSTAASL